MKSLQITRATLHERKLQDGSYDAWYTCDECGQDLGSADGKRTPEEARASALCGFDIQCRNYCYTCGTKLTDKVRE